MMTASTELPGHFVHLERGQKYFGDRRADRGKQRSRNSRRIYACHRVRACGARLPRRVEEGERNCGEFQWRATPADVQEQRQIGCQERRQAPRRNLNAPGWIRLDGGFGLRECKIVDVSTSGVRIFLPFAGKLPEIFTLLLSKTARGHRSGDAPIRSAQSLFKIKSRFFLPGEKLLAYLAE
jgi:PilZ domain